MSYLLIVQMDIVNRAQERPEDKENQMKVEKLKEEKPTRSRNDIV